MSKSDPKAALQTAIEIAGGISAMAKQLRLSGHSVINQWRLTRVPAEQCPRIERATKGLVRCEDLRPDVDWAVLRNRANRRNPSINAGAEAIKTIAT